MLTLSQALVFTTLGDYLFKEGDHCASTLDMAIFLLPTTEPYAFISN